MTKTEDRRTVIFYEQNPMMEDNRVFGIVKAPAQTIYDFAQIMLPNLPIGRYGYISLRVVNNFQYTRIGDKHYIKAFDGIKDYTFNIDYKFIGAMLKEPKYFKVQY